LRGEGEGVVDLAKEALENTGFDPAEELE